MTVKNIKGLVTKFPVLINLSDGRQLSVGHTDYLLYLPPISGEVVIVVEKTGQVHMVDAAQIVDVTFERQEA